ncbi:MAG: 3-phosphoshikimate 1-carboxyvinyltransferase [Planctomycetota bacterium]
MRVVEIEVPGCKSTSQRALILAALAAGESRLQGLSEGEDSDDLIAALRVLGWSLKEENGALVVQGSAGPRPSEASKVVLGEGASTLRFLVPMLAAAPQDLELEVAEGLRKRPQEAMQTVLQELGATLTPTADGFHLHSQPIAVAEPVAVPADLSSQFLSGFLQASGTHAMSWQPSGELVSQGYLAMTTRLLRQFRGKDALDDSLIPWRQPVGFGTGQSITILSDASAIVFFAVAAILQQITIRICRPWDPLHPDVAVLDFLTAHGLLQVEGQDLIPAAAPSSLAAKPQPIFDLQESPDSGPALAVLAAALPDGIDFRNGERLQFKESDRIDGVQRLRQLALDPTAQPFDPTNDHRLAMAAGIATLGYPTASILQPECVAKSFPGFWEQIDRLR